MQKNWLDSLPDLTDLEIPSYRCDFCKREVTSWWSVDPFIEALFNEVIEKFFCEECLAQRELDASLET